MSETVDRTAAIAKVVIGEMEHVDTATERKARRRAERSWGQAAPQVDEEVRKIERTVQAERAQLLREPFVAFLRTHQDGRETVLLFCRSYTPECKPSSGGIEYVSYLAPVGAIAARPLGTATTIQAPGGARVIRLLERNVFRPRRSGQWDAIDNQIELARGEYRFEASLRALLPPADLETAAEEVAEDFGLSDTVAEADPTADLGLIEVEVAAADATEASPALRPKRASIAEAVQLRDQPVLDEVQDPAFRLPIGTRLVITGAPGTGKTTLLIKRLSQKTKLEFLTREERQGLSSPQVEGLLERHRAWVLFTPSELLRDYLKEALGREGLAATNSTVRLWSDERMILARDVLRILQVGRQGYFRYAPKLAAPAGFSAAEVLESFDAYFKARHRRRTERDLQRLDIRAGALRQLRGNVESGGALLAKGSGTQAAVVRLLGRLTQVLRSAANPVDAALACSPLRADVKELRAAIEELEPQMADALLQRDPKLVQTLGPVSATARMRLLDVLNQMAVVDASGADWKDLGEEELTAATTVARQSILADPLYADLARAVQLWKESLRAASSAIQTIDSLFASVPSAYAAFRKREFETNESDTIMPPPPQLNQTGGSAQREAPKPPLSITETDLLVFFCLRMSDDIMTRVPAGSELSNGSRVLGGIHDRFRTIVAVDEATDFSWVQLGCMYYLSDPTWRSFAVCGDLMQRVTTHGLRRWEDCERFAPDIQVLPLRIAYRQSRTLLQIARRMYLELVGEEPPFDSPYAEEEEPLPLLLRAGDLRAATKWVAERIVEIYEIYAALPTVAVFVPEDSDVDEVSRHLTDWLEEHALAVDACTGGRILGEGQRVRVFSVEHIKGLEFHAVFLVGFDRMHERSAEIAARYLYVGLSRAIMFLGVTVEKSFPAALDFIEGEFDTGTWGEFVLPGADSEW